MKTIKQTSRILGLALLLTLCLSLLAPSAFADITEGQTGSISVSGAEAGVTVNAYKIIDVNFDTTNQQPESPMFQWDSNVVNWVRDNYSTYINDDNGVTEEFTGSDSLPAFYDALAAAIRNNTITGLALSTTTANYEGGATIDSLGMGNYLVLIEGGMKVYTPSAVNLQPVYDDGHNSYSMSTANVSLKSSEPTLDKSINESVSDGHPSGKDQISDESTTYGRDNADIGDEVTFDLRAHVPTYPANATAKTYAISDVLPTGLTLVEGSIAVDVDGTQIFETTHYARSIARPNNLGSSTFTLTFNDTFLSTYAGKTVHITYKATLNAGATVGQPGNTNHAYLDYNNNPYDTSSFKTKEDKTTVYTYGIDVSKRANSADGALLTGAQFKLTTDSNGEQAINLVSEGNGVYRMPASSAESGTAALEVGSTDSNTGKLIIKGLDAGTYYLTETVAPGGYTLPAGAVEVVITDSDYDGAAEVTDNDPITSGLVPVTVINTPGFSLPTTGGAGTMAFTAIGVVLMGAGLIVFLLGRRRKAQDEA